MPSTLTSKATPTKPKKDRERKEKPPVVAERLKTVVRRLPPNLPEDVFWNSVDPWVSHETSSWRVYYPGKSRKRLGKENIPSRAYIAFRNEEQLALFSREYDGHLFRDKVGNESQAVVEFAPYQKIPSDKRKVDARNATIEKDEDYISFIESLKASAKAEPASIETLIAANKPAPPPTTTPLLEALKAEKSASKDKEAILRNHPHYKDATILTPIPRKEEAKKKGAPAAQRAPEPTSPAGKKPSKKLTSAPPAPASGQKPPLGPAKANAGPPSIRPKSPKPPRAPKAPPQPRAIQGGAKPAPPTAQGTATTEGLISAAAPPPPGTSAPLAAAAAPSRRTRPVIGLVSRQFEAALSGAGVSAGERKSRRERERESAKEKETQAGDGSTGSGSVGANMNVPPKISPPSPRRDRHAKQSRDIASAGVSVAPGGPANTGTLSGSAVQVSGILQRIDRPPAGTVGEQKEDGATALVPDGASQSQGTLGSGSRGGRRGRGRGRGGVPGAPVRGG